MCMVIIRQILVLPIHNFCVLLCMLWACNGDQKAYYIEIYFSVQHLILRCLLVSITHSMCA
jgi:hypothetical protein